MGLKLTRLIPEKTCAWCGKTFTTTVPLYQYLYKVDDNHKTKYFCCYTCREKWDDKYGNHRRILK